MCLTLRWPFKQFWQVCTVLILSSMQENISSPVTDLGRKLTATGIAAPLSSKVAIVTSALVIRLVFIFSGSGRGCFFTNFSSTLCVRPITCFWRESYSRPGFRAMPSLAKATGMVQTSLSTIACRSAFGCWHREWSDCKWGLIIPLSVV